MDVHTRFAYTCDCGVHRASTFTALIAEYIEDDEYPALQSFWRATLKPAMSCQGRWLSEAEWTDRRRGKGKRGGLIYYHLSTDAHIWLMTLYDKGEVADLSVAGKRLLKAGLDAELARRAARRGPRRK